MANEATGRLSRRQRRDFAVMGETFGVDTLERGYFGNVARAIEELQEGTPITEGTEYIGEDGRHPAVELEDGTMIYVDQEEDTCGCHITSVRHVDPETGRELGAETPEYCTCNEL